MKPLDVVKLSGAEPGKPVDARASVAYGERAIVSRTLFKGPGGSLTAFAFDAGEELSTHTAPFDAVLEVLEGRARVTVGRGEAVELAAGEIVILPSNVPHAVQAAERMKMLLTILRGPAQ